MSKVPKLVWDANERAAGVEHVKFIKRENVRERFATLAQATVKKAQLEKAKQEEFVETFVDNLFANVVRGFAEADAAAKLQAAVKAHGAHKVPVKVETDSDIDTMVFRTPASDNLLKDVERHAVQNPQPVNLTAALLARANEQAPGNALLIELIQLVTQLNETVTDYARRLEILEAERATGNGQ